jgi:hypothetical protein
MSKEHENKAIAVRWLEGFWGRSWTPEIVDALAADDVLIQFYQALAASALLTVACFCRRSAGRSAIIYHYCRAEAFVEILRTRSMWLSASYVMNDITERSWGYRIFQRAGKALEEETGREFIARVTAPVVAGDTHSML